MRKTIKTRSELADILGVHRSTMTRWLKRYTWRFGPGPWRLAVLPEIRQWGENVREGCDADNDPVFVAWAHRKFPELWEPPC